MGSSTMRNGLPSWSRNVRRRLQIFLEQLRNCASAGSSSTTVTMVVGIDEAGQVVNVAVGVVADDAFAQPEDLVHAEVIAQICLDLRSWSECGLRLGLSRQASVVSSVPRPLTSMEPPSRIMPRREERQIAQLGDVLGNGVIEIEGRIFAAPGVVAPIDDGALAPAVLVAHQKNRAVIAAPRFVGREMMETHALQRAFRLCAASRGPRLPFRRSRR